MSTVMAVRFRQKQGICCLVEGLPARQVSVVHGIILSKCKVRRRTQLCDVCIGTGLLVAIKSNTGNVFPHILFSFRILDCYTSITNDKISCSLTDNLKQFVQKLEFLKGSFHEFFKALLRNCQKRLLAASYLSLRPSEWNNSDPNGRIFMKGIFRKSVEKIQVPLKSEKNNWNFTWRPIYLYGSISLNSCYNVKCFGQNL
jgi:hypothetical protein